MDIGQNHGVKFSSIAIAEGVSTPWRLLQVVELGNNYTILETLGKLENLRQMNGLEIKFLPEM